MEWSGGEGRETFMDEWSADDCNAGAGPSWSRRDVAACRPRASIRAASTSSSAAAAGQLQSAPTSGISTSRWARLPWDDVAVQLRPQRDRRPRGKRGGVGRRRVRAVTDICGPIAGWSGRSPRAASGNSWPSAEGHLGRSPAGRFQPAAEDHQPLRHRQHVAEQRAAEPRHVRAEDARATCCGARAGSRSLRRSKARATSRLSPRRSIVGTPG